MANIKVPMPITGRIESIEIPDKYARTPWPLRKPHLVASGNPEYVYLLNLLNIARDFRPFNTDLEPISYDEIRIFNPSYKKMTWVPL